MAIDQFSLYQAKVKEYLDTYTQVMKKHAPDYEGYSKSINKLAKPFIDGYFTLAVVGKMSAGKSTFINALIGNKDILPTDHFQTTCTLTKIRHGEQKQVHVTYANGAKTTLVKNIEADLKLLVAIPEEYQELPINQINRLIIEGKNESDILGQKGFLTEKSAQNIDLDKLNKYIKSHNKGNIVSEVVIELPLPQGYRGWQIVDTPGVDAIGGIEDTTNEFLSGKNEDGYNNVDAVIFVHSGKGQIEDRGINKLVEKTFESLADDAKKRMFFIITHASDSTFRKLRDENINRAVKLFVEYEYGLKKERLVCVDSLCALLYPRLVSEGINLSDEQNFYKVPEGWTESDWDFCSELVSSIRKDLYRKDAELNNENILTSLEEIAGFESFKTQINNFVKSEKEKAFNKFINRIIQDLDFCINIKKNDRELIKKKATKSHSEFEKDIKKEKAKLEETEGKMSTFLGEAREDIPNEVNKKFDSMEEDLESFRELLDIKTLEAKANELRIKLLEIHNETAIKLSEIFEKQLNSSLDMYLMEPVDCTFILEDLRKWVGDKESYTRLENKKGFWSAIWRALGTGGMQYVYDEDAHIKALKVEVESQFKASMKASGKSIDSLILEAGSKISESFHSKIDKIFLKLDKLLEADKETSSKYNIEIDNKTKEISELYLLKHTINNNSEEVTNINTEEITNINTEKVINYNTEKVVNYNRNDKTSKNNANKRKLKRKK